MPVVLGGNIESTFTETVAIGSGSLSLDCNGSRAFAATDHDSANPPDQLAAAFNRSF